MSWADAVLYRQPDVLTVDLLLVAAGLWLLWRPRFRTRAALEPAE
jgi:hypothetical protein